MTTNDMTLLLVGSTGNGKSATGNSILRQQAFKTSASTSSTEAEFAIKSNIFNDVQLNVVDCPGVDTEKGAEEVLNSSIETIKKGLKLCDYRFSALLIVLKYGARFTKQESDFIKTVKGILGQNVIRDYGVCIMTHGDNFEADNEDENVSFKDWCQDQEGEIKNLFKECNHRYVLFNNRIKDQSLKDSQVSELLAIVPRNALYNESHFKAADKDLQKFIIETKMPRIVNETNDYLEGKRKIIETIQPDQEIGKQIQSYTEVLNQVNDFEKKLISKYHGEDNIQQPLDVIKIFKMNLNIKLKNCEQNQQLQKAEQKKPKNMNRSRRDPLPQTKTPDKGNDYVSNRYGSVDHQERSNQEGNDTTRRTTHTNEVRHSNPIKCCCPVS